MANESKKTLDEGAAAAKSADQVDPAAGTSAAQPRTVPMRAPDKHASANVQGTPYEADAKGRIEALIEHVEALVSHGWKVLTGEASK